MLTTFMAQASNPGNLEEGESWDLKTFFDNATSSVQTIGGSLLALVGISAVVVGAVFLVKKLWSEQDRTSWFKIVALILIGGALAFTGISMVLNFARGGQKTIDDLGSGTSGVIAAPVVPGAGPDAICGDAVAVGDTGGDTATAHEVR